MPPSWLRGSLMIMRFTIAALVFGVIQLASAEPMTNTVANQTLQVEVSGGSLIQLPANAASVFVADPTIADVQMPAASRVFVFGKKPGFTTFFALSSSGVPLMATKLEVRFPQAELQARMRAEAGNSPVSLSYTPHGAVLGGTVPTLGAAQHLHDLAAATLGTGVPLLNQVQVAGAVQVNLRVRVAEVSRSVSRQLGFNWSTIVSAGNFAFGLETGRFTTVGSTLIGNGIDGVFGTVASRRVNASAVLDAMADEGLVTMLAEPNLTAMSGATATFLAGGELPIPVPQALGVTSIEYKRYGVSIGFTPTVLATNRISMKLRPEVSAIDTTNSISLNNVTVPALTAREAETEVELSSGQSFAIAGLIQNNVTNNIQKLPWLGDLPVLGALFRSSQFQRNQTELVIVVTPYVVQPTTGRPPDANDSVSAAPSDLDALAFGRVSKPAAIAAPATAAPPQRGAAGFLFE